MSSLISIYPFKLHSVPYACVYYHRIPGDASCVEFTTSSQTRVATQSVVSEMQSITGSIEGPDVMGEMLFEHIDRDKLSLSDQAGLGLQQERLPLDDRLTLSLQEKFTVPESLSETLTAEVVAFSTVENLHITLLCIFN